MILGQGQGVSRGQNQSWFKGNRQNLGRPGWLKKKGIGGDGGGGTHGGGNVGGDGSHGGGVVVAAVVREVVVEDNKSNIFIVCHS